MVSSSVRKFENSGFGRVGCICVGFGRMGTARLAMGIAIGTALGLTLGLALGLNFGLNLGLRFGVCAIRSCGMGFCAVGFAVSGRRFKGLAMSLPLLSRSRSFG